MIGVISAGNEPGVVHGTNIWRMPRESNIMYLAKAADFAGRQS